MSLLSKLFGGQKKLSSPIDLGVLVNDVHSHFIPGIDDGAQTIEDSLTLIQGMTQLGYKKVITTPHIMSDTYRNGPENILPGLEKVREALQQNGITTQIEAAAEYYIDADLEEKIKGKKLLTFGKKNYVLFEMPFVGEPTNLNSVIFELQLAGYTPVMAHVERYPFWHHQPEKIISLRDKGVIIQMNISSLTGYYSPAVKKVAEKLIDENAIDLVGSDCHHTGHLQLLEQARYIPHLKKLIESGRLINHEL